MEKVNICVEIHQGLIYTCLNCGNENPGYEMLFDSDGDIHCPDCASYLINSPK